MPGVRAHMRLAVLDGATDTSYYAVVCALDAGYQVNALVDSSSHGRPVSSAATYVEGDVTNRHSVEEALNGAHAVIGIFDYLAEDELTAVVRNLVAAMQNHGQRRLIVSFSDDSRACAGALKVLKRSRLDWTVIRPFTLLQKRDNWSTDRPPRPASPKKIATFMLHEITSATYVQRSVALSA